MKSMLPAGLLVVALAHPAAAFAHPELGPSRDGHRVGRPAGQADERGAEREAELDALVTEIAARLRCPECRAQSVAESNSRISRAMRDDIRTRLEAGETPEQIEQFFLDSYGDFILLRPRAEGASLLVYLLPGLAFALAIGIALIRLRGRSRSGGEHARAEAGSRDTDSTARPDVVDDRLDPDDRAWLEAAIRGEA